MKRIHRYEALLKYARNYIKSVPCSGEKILEELFFFIDTIIISQKSSVSVTFSIPQCLLAVNSNFYYAFDFEK